MDPRFQRSKYLLKFGCPRRSCAWISIVDPETDELLFYSRLNNVGRFPDFPVFGDRDEMSTILTIKAPPKFNDLAPPTFAVQYAPTGESVGSLRRKWLKSLVRVEWTIFNATGVKIATLREDCSVKRALARQLEFGQSRAFNIEAGGRIVAQFHDEVDPYWQLRLDFTGNNDGLLDPRLGIGAAVLIAADEEWAWGASGL